MVDKGLVLFIGERGRDHRLVEARIFVIKEKVQFMARILGVEPTLLGDVQLVPFRHKVKLGENRIRIECREEPIKFRDRAERLEPRGRQIGHRHRLAGLQRRDQLLFGKRLGRVQPFGQPQVARFHRRVIEKRAGEHGRGRIRREHAQAGQALERRARNRECPRRIRHQIQQRHGGLAQEIERGEPFGHLGVLLCLGRHRAALSLGLLRRAARIRAARREPLFIRLGRAQRPGVEQQAGTFQHVAGERARLLTVEDVAVLVADVAP